MISLAVSVREPPNEAKEEVARMVATFVPSSRDGVFHGSSGALSWAAGLLSTRTEDESAFLRFDQRSVGPGRVLLVCPARGAERIHSELGQSLLEAFESNSPTALADCPNFDWALCWDPKQGRLWLLRDPFGARSFFYASGSRSVRVATTVSALLQVVSSREPDWKTVAEHLKGTYRRAKGTFFRDIQRLLPGHILEWTSGGGITQRRWFVPRLKPFAGVTVEDALEGFRHHLKAAVRRDLESRSAVILQLSGGMDSSAIVALSGQLAAEDCPNLRDRIALSTGTFQGLDCDETRYASLVAKNVPFPWLPWSALQPGFRDLRGEEMDLSLPNAGGLVSWAVPGDFEVAKRRNAHVLVTGIGGNQVSGEGGYLTDLLASSEALAFVWHFLASGDPRLLGLPSWWRTRQALEAVAWRCGLRLATPPVEQPFHWVGPRLREEWNRDADDWAAFESERRSIVLPSAMGKATWLSLTSQFTYWDAEQLDRRCGEAGVESRSPFLDSALANFVMALPSKLRPPRSKPRALQRYALRGMVPWRLLGRHRNTHFAAADEHHGRAASGLMWPILDDDRWLLEGYVDRGAAREVWRKLVNSPGPPEHRAWRRLRKICSLEVWLRKLFG